jgi:SARP family transcriptional regulator, regulator of embCAB operon
MNHDSPRVATYFRVLGPLQVQVGGADATPSAQKLRTVLAMLLMSANSVLAGDAVAEELWGARPPASARNTLQSYIVHLRHSLQGDDSARIETKSYGYELVADPRALDLTAFRDHIAAAYHARVRCELERARELLAAALRLWRGRPLVNVPMGPMLQASYSYLNELWLSAVERRIAIDVELGRHHDVLGELTLLVRQHPLNENLTAQLMLALYRSGRRYAALESYHALRRTLAEEIGLDTCPALQRMHHAVLTCDPMLDREREGTSSLLAIDMLSA